MPESNKQGMDDYAPRWLISLGLRGWILVGVAGAVLVVAYVFGRASGLFIPLIVAAVLGMLFYPVVDALEKARLPRAAGALIVMVVMIVVAVLTGWVAVAGILQQSGEIAKQLAAGFEAIKTYVDSAEISPAILERAVESAKAAIPQIASGIAGIFSSSLSGLIAFGFGIFIGGFILFYMLADWTTLADWFGDHLGFPQDVGRGIVEDSTSAMRQYFKGLTISSLLVSVLIGIAMWLLGLPLALTIVLVTFLTSYIPYLGAIFSGAFAFVIALGSGGLEKATIVLVVILVTQNLVQTVVQNYYASEELDLHPLVTLIATILGATFMGLIGSMLGAPLAAMGVRTFARVKGYNEGVARDSHDPSTL